MVGARIAPAQPTSALPAIPGSLKFAVIGDSGTGDSPQFDISARMAEARNEFTFDLVIMLGDNIYGRQQTADFVAKFERPYAMLLQSGVRFFASLGNHDSPNNRFYPGFNMDGKRYYSFVRKNTRFVVLDSNQLDPRQLAWIDGTLKQSSEEWKICYFHHPIYSDGGRHGSDIELRVVLEPLFVKYGVDVVYSGHDHIYERTKPQKGVTYFVNQGNNFGSGPEIQGIATFAQSPGFTQQAGSAFVSFADPTNAVLAKGDASGTLAIGGTFTTLDQVNLSNNVRIRGTASSVDVG